MSTLANMLVRINADASQFEKHMGKVEKRLKGVGSQFADVGSRLTQGVTLPILAVGGTALKASIDFESAFAGVRKTVNGSEEDFAKLESGIRDMAKEIPQSASSIAGIAEAAGQLGIQTENILSFTRTMADLGVATNLTGEEAATTFARFANITQMPQDQFDRLGSTIVALGNNLATTESEIAAMGLRLAGAGEQIGLTEAQILSFAASLSSVGIEAEAGGSAFSRVMIDIANSVASGDDKLATFAQVAGMTADQFSQAFETDAAGAIVAFTEGLGRMNASGENTFAVLDELGLSEIRVRDALLRASGAGDLFRNSLELGSKAWEENTALTNEAQQRYATTQSQLTILWNKLQDVAITLGDAIAPAFSAAIDAAKPFIDGIGQLATWFANLDPGIQSTIVTVVAMIAAIGPLVFVVGKVISAVSGLVAVVKALGTAMAFLSANPIALVIAGIVALIAVGVLIYKNWDEISAWLVKTWESIKTVALDVWNGIASFFTSIWDSITGALKSAWDGIVSTVKTVWNGIADFFREWTGTILLGIFTGGIGLLVLTIAKNWDTIREGIVTAWETITTTLSTWASTAWNAIVSTLQAIPAWFAGLWDNAVSSTVTAWTKLVSTVTTWVSTFKTKMVEGLESAWDYLKALPSKLLEWGKNAITGFVKGFLSIKIPVPSFGIDWKEGPLGVDIPSISVGINWRDLKSFVPFLADGGIVNGPTLAMIGEAGPEAVVPLDRLGEMGEGGGSPTIVINWSSIRRPNPGDITWLAGEINKELGKQMGGAYA